MLHELRLFCIAVQFLTRVPVPRRVGFEPDWLNQSARHFPAVGACVGAVAALVLWAASAVFPPAVAVGLSLAATLLLTGGFHEDGLADTCDALGGAVSRERALEIMKDSRIGSYGAAGLVLALALKAALLVALVEIDPLFACIALAWSHAASRAAPVWLSWKLPYAGDAAHAKAKPLATQINGVTVCVALGWVLLLSLMLVAGAHYVSDAEEMLSTSTDEYSTAAVFTRAMEYALVAAVAAISLAGWIAARWLTRRIGGFTGDTLGALQQVCEIVSLMVWLAVAHGG